MSATGLTLPQRVRARRLAVNSMKVLLKNAPAVHYSQRPDRFSGIAQHKRAYKGQFPATCDCSSSTTWALWDATRKYKLGDFVNGAGWKAGYTGTQQNHGKRVTGRKLPGDLVFYGNQGGGVAEHVAMYVGSGLVISQGSERGPFLLRFDYRPVAEVRRYLR